MVERCVHNYHGFDAGQTLGFRKSHTFAAGGAVGKTGVTAVVLETYPLIDGVRQGGTQVEIGVVVHQGAGVDADAAALLDHHLGEVAHEPLALLSGEIGGHARSADLRLLVD